MRIGAFLLAFAVLNATASRPAFAEPVLDDNDRTKKLHDTPHTEFDPVPLVGGDSDIGWGGGAVVQLVRHEPGYDPYRWSIEAAGLVTFKLPTAGGGSFQTPYQDYYALLKVPDLVRHRIRIEVRPSYSNEATLKYYGLGNGSQVSPRTGITDPYYEFGHIHPTLLLQARLTLTRPLYLLVGNAFSYHSFTIPQDTRLAQEQATGSAEVRRLLGGFGNHAVDLFEYAIVYDTRDNDFEARSGMWHQADLRLSPGGTDFMPYRYGEADITLRGYVTPIKDRLTLAVRVVGDWMFGNVPFYELAQFEGTYALGGVNGVRGIPAQRYYGKEKIFGNVEARASLVDFRLFRKSFGVGLATFFDAGRVWADEFNHPELDGKGLGLKYGVGGGLRLHQGASMVIRFDVAWSPDAQPISAYFAAGEIF